MTLALIKAIYAAGFRAGHKSGSDEATSWDWGSHPTEPQTATESWDQEVNFDVSDIKKWEDVG